MTTTQTTESFSHLAPGTVIIVKVSSRKRPFRATLSDECKGFITDAKGVGFAVVEREDGSVCHLVQYGQRAGVFPREVQLVSWSLAN